MNKTCSLLALRLSVMLSATMALTGCFEPSVETTKPDDAQALVDALVYVRAKIGLCFGVGTTARLDTGGKISLTNQVVHVPCAAVGL